MDVFAYGAFEDFEDGFFGHGFVLIVSCWVLSVDVKVFFVLSVTGQL